MMKVVVAALRQCVSRMDPRIWFTESASPRSVSRVTQLRDATRSILSSQQISPNSEADVYN